MTLKKGFTLVELMVVVLIVGILAAVAIPMMQGRIDAAKWSEGKAGAGTIASALRAYAAEEGNFSSAPSLADIGIADGDLDGTYFSDACYAITSASYSDSGLSFVITVTASSSEGSRDYPTNPSGYTLTVSNGGPAQWAKVTSGGD